jgi:nitroreductase
MTAAFDAAFRAQFRELVLWRRDVRRFRSDPIARERIDALLEIASHAPSVGLSQPWRFVHVDSAERRLAVVKSFTDANEKALLLDNRNKAWLPKIEALLQSPKTYFITVGAAHLTGKNSVIDLLCQKHRNLQRIQTGPSAPPPACPA